MIFINGSMAINEIAGANASIYRDTILEGLNSQAFVSFENYLHNDPTIGPALDNFQRDYNTWLLDSNSLFPKLSDNILNMLSAAGAVYQQYESDIKELIKNPENIIPTFIEWHCQL